MLGRRIFKHDQLLALDASHTFVSFMAPINVFLNLTWIVAHFFGLFLTFFCLVERLIYYKLWFDNTLATISACGDAALLGMLIFFISEKDRSVTSSEYRLIIIIYFLVLWSSRASLALSNGRSHIRFRGNLAVNFSAAATTFIGIGVIYCAVSAILCGKKLNCTELKHECFCYLPTMFVAFMLATDIIVDVGMVGVTWYIFQHKLVSLKPARKRLVVLGFSSNMFTLISSLLCWVMFLSRVSKNPLLLLCLINSVAITSVLASNMPVLIGFLSRRLCGEHPNAERPLNEIEHSTNDIEQITNDIEHSTNDIEHST